ncbi:hypothetical protein R3I94_023265 [Phoxinus phoxinus]
MMLSLAFLLSSGRDVDEDYEKWKKITIFVSDMITLALKGLLLWHISFKVEIKWLGRSWWSFRR